MSNTIVNTNISAINSHRAVLQVGSRLNRSSERLSSGMRINRAADDAAGMTLSEKMRNQIRGLDQATRNSQDGISLVQTAEGAMEEIHRILERTRELMVQSANDVYTLGDRVTIFNEVSNLLREIDSIVQNTKFNTMNLLSGVRNTSIQENISIQDLENIELLRIALDEAIFDYREFVRRRLGMGSFDRTPFDANNFFSSNITIYENPFTSAEITTWRNEYIANGGPTAFELRVLELVNIERKNHGLNALQWDYNLGAAARFKSQSMAHLDYFSHDGVHGNPSDLGALFGVTTGVGENIINGSACPYGAVQGWMNSVGHRNNILNSSHTHLGAGFFVAPSGNSTLNGVAGTLMFTNDGTGAPLQAQEQLPAWANINGRLIKLRAVREAKVNLETAIQNTKITNSINDTIQNLVLQIQTGANAGQRTTINIRDMSLESLNLHDITNLSDIEIDLQISGINQETGLNLAEISLQTLDLLISNYEFRRSMIPVYHLDSTIWYIGKIDSNWANWPFGGGVVHNNTLGIEISSLLNQVDNAINIVSRQRAELGSVQNRLEHTINNLRVSSENLSSSNSRIRDIDMAREMMAFTQTNILGQAGISMLAQSNIASQSVLQLLG